MSQLRGHLPEAERLLKPAEASRRLGISPRTLYQWSVSGKPESILTPGGTRRYRESAINSVLDAMTAAGARQ